MTLSKSLLLFWFSFGQSSSRKKSEVPAQFQTPRSSNYKQNTESSFGAQDRGASQSLRPPVVSCVSISARRERQRSCWVTAYTNLYSIPLWIKPLSRRPPSTCSWLKDPNPSGRSSRIHWPSQGTLRNNGSAKINILPSLLRSLSAGWEAGVVPLHYTRLTEANTSIGLPNVSELQLRNNQHRRLPLCDRAFRAWGSGVSDRVFRVWDRASRV